MRLILFTGPFCPACSRMKEALDELKVEYEEVSVSDYERYVEMCELVGIYIRHLPTLVVYDETRGTRGMIVGAYTPTRLAERLEELGVEL